MIAPRSAFRPAAGSSRYQVPNLERGLKIMELLADHPGGLMQSEIAAALRCSKTSVYRITTTLVDYGYLDRDQETKALRLSRKLVAMGSRALAEEDLMSISIDVLHRLRDAVRETVLLGTLVGTELVVLGQVLGNMPFKFSLDLGARLPLHTAAPGKAILCRLPESERTALLGRIDFRRFNDRTITSVQDLADELVRAAADGYAVDRGEQLSGIHCVAAPIVNRHGYPIAALWATGPAERLREEDFPQAGALVKEHGRLISRRLGYGLLANHEGHHHENGMDRLR